MREVFNMDSSVRIDAINNLGKSCASLSLTHLHTPTVCLCPMYLSSVYYCCSCFLVAKFGSVAVVEALLDLLDDQEHDVRASACISLAKSKAGDRGLKIDRLMRCLRDTDRFVRESACIALGYLKADSAVPVLLQIW